MEWDSWRREDGRWTLVADYRAGERNRHAEFVFDAPGRYVVAEDDEARWLVGEQPVGKGTQQRTGGAPRRLSAVGDDEELPLGEDAIGMVAEIPPAPVEAPAGPRGRGAHRGPERHRGRRARHRRRRLDRHPGQRASGAAWSSAASPTTTSRRLHEPGRSETAEPAEPTEPAADEPGTPRRTAKKKSRASVPSWDEIMFGGGKRE